MKKCVLAFLCVAFLLTMCSCTGEKYDVETVTEKSDYVNSIALYTFAENTFDNCISYEMSYNSGELNMSAIITMPKDYEKKSYPVLVYLPEIALSHERMAQSFAKNGIISMALYPRGMQNSEGQKDLGGEDLEDVKTLYDICTHFKFVNDKNIFIAGSGEGSINALQLAAKYSKADFKGVAVVDCISDLSKTYFSKQEYYDYYIGSSYYDAGEIYFDRSAINFTEKFNCKVLVINNMQNGEYPLENDNAFYKALKHDSVDVSFKKVSDANTDFSGKALNELVKWIKE